MNQERLCRPSLHAVKKRIDGGYTVVEIDGYGGGHVLSSPVGRGSAVVGGRFEGG